MNDNEIRKLFEKFGASIFRDDVWNVQQAIVIKHKALERLAASAGIVWERPTVLRAERDEAVVLVTGTLADRSEWSIGEALINANYRVSGRQAPYVYAMAEKRAKDRVIIKLCGLHGLYSEDEADEFRDAAPAPRQERAKEQPKAVLAAITEMPPADVDKSLWETAYARAGGGTASYRAFWKNDTTEAERAVLTPFHDALKARAATMDKHPAVAAVNAAFPAQAAE